MTAPDFAALAAQHRLGDEPIPEVVLAIADGRPANLAWRNDLGGLTFRIGDVFAKWNPRRTGIDLDRERVRLEWLAGRHPAPMVLDHGADAEAQLGHVRTRGVYGQPVVLPTPPRHVGE